MSATCRLCLGQPDAEVVASWELVIDRDAPSQNVLATNSGKHRWGYKAERDTWYRMFLGEVGQLILAGKAGRDLGRAAAPRRVTFTRRYSGRKQLRDHANVIGGMKPVVDAMVLAGLLVDDSPKFFTAYYRQERVERGGGTAILIEEVAP